MQFYRNTNDAMRNQWLIVDNSKYNLNLLNYNLCINENTT